MLQEDPHPKAQQADLDYIYGTVLRPRECLKEAGGCLPADRQAPAPFDCHHLLNGNLYITSEIDGIRDVVPEISPLFLSASATRQPV
jgi:hypothetical protein